jgi:hypothetical protein
MFSNHRSGPGSPDERDRDAKVLPPPAPTAVAGPRNFRDDATPADLPSGSYSVFLLVPFAEPGADYRYITHKSSFFWSVHRLVRIYARTSREILGRRMTMKFNKDRNWLAKRAEQEDRNFISVGGLISRIDPEWQADVSSVPNVEATKTAFVRLLQLARRERRLSLEQFGAKGRCRSGGTGQD